MVLCRQQTNIDFGTWDTALTTTKCRSGFGTAYGRGWKSFEMHVRKIKVALRDCDTEI